MRPSKSADVAVIVRASVRKLRLRLLKKRGDKGLAYASVREELPTNLTASEWQSSNPPNPTQAGTTEDPQLPRDHGLYLLRLEERLPVAAIAL